MFDTAGIASFASGYRPRAILDSGLSKRTVTEVWIIWAG